jgi:hypothetical protein
MEKIKEGSVILNSRKKINFRMKYKSIKLMGDQETEFKFFRTLSVNFCLSFQQNLAQILAVLGGQK